MYDTEEYIETILDIGTSMISSGAETHCVEDSLYMLASNCGDLLLSVISASIICALYAEVMARIKKCPAIIFRIIAILPLLPGTDFYYMMNGIVMGNTALYLEKKIICCLHALELPLVLWLWRLQPDSRQDSQEIPIDFRGKMKK